MLDLAFGEAHKTRQFRAVVCNGIIGVDLSEKTIKSAEGLEATHEHGIDYLAKNGADISVFGTLPPGWSQVRIEFLVGTMEAEDRVAFLGRTFCEHFGNPYLV